MKEHSCHCSDLVVAGLVLNKAKILSALQSRGLIDHSADPGVNAQVRMEYIVKSN